MIAYRISHRDFPALDGLGAARLGGRWNPVGVPAIYAAESRALAMAEVLVHLNSRPASMDYLLTTPEVMDGSLRRLESIESDPRILRSAAERQRIGGEFLTSSPHSVLLVPSVIIPAEGCLFFHPAAVEAGTVRLTSQEAFAFDPRLF